MATTDAKPGFRLPWSADRSESEAPAETAGDAPIGEALTTDQEIETPDMIDAAPAASDQMATVDDPSAVSGTTAEGHEPIDSASVAATPPDAPVSGAKSTKPNKFMADLTKAMQGAAETAKADTLARFTADAKGHIETIHSSTAVEAGELRKQADDDVASIREWSKAEIARIREETDERITHRKARLEREIDAHAAEIEGRIQRVQRRVDAFEAEMAAFFERLLAEEDATRFAAMAQSLPEPPPFDTETAEDRQAAEASVAETEELPAERAVVIDPWPETPAEGVTKTVDEAATTDEPEATAEAVADADALSTTDVQPTTDDAVETESVASDDAPVADESESTDPRLEALGVSPDFAAAEAEAAAFTPEDGPAEEITVIADDALAARLAGLVPDADAPSNESNTTRLVVTGLVSVASIAGFKRQLSRVAGVLSVGVSSGPDGEFLFAVTHDPGIVLRDAVTTLPGFGARVTAEADGELTVTAKDPEAEG
jgi:hypothetical protein